MDPEEAESREQQLDLLEEAFIWRCFRVKNPFSLPSWAHAAAEAGANASAFAWATIILMGGPTGCRKKHPHIIKLGQG